MALYSSILAKKKGKIIYSNGLYPSKTLERRVKERRSLSYKNNPPLLIKERGIKGVRLVNTLDFKLWPLI